jgi:hypothetical protein
MLTTCIIVASLCLTYVSIHWVLPRLPHGLHSPVRAGRAIDADPTRIPRLDSKPSTSSLPRLGNRRASRSADRAHPPVTRRRG